MSDRDLESEVELWAALERLLPKSRRARVMDIGANEGQFITELSKIVEVEALCVEPGNDAYQRLKLNISSLPGVEAVQLAIAETAGQQDFYESESGVGSSLIRPIAGQQSSWARTVGTTKVATARLDGVMSDWGQTLDLLKVDTQGTDLRVLRSAGERLSPDSVAAVLVAVNLHPIYEHQDSFAGVLAELEPRGYFLAELFRYYNRLGWLWYADALFLPQTAQYAT